MIDLTYCWQPIPQRLAAGQTSRAGGRASRDQGAGQGVPRARPGAAGAIVDTAHVHAVAWRRDKAR